jgi:methionyl-tRNA formyltransferase
MPSAAEPVPPANVTHTDPARMRIAFAGTPPFAAAALSALHAAGHDVTLVLTQPDRPAGRGMQLQASAVKQVAQSLALPLAQPRSLRLDGRYPADAAAAQQALQAANPQVLVVAAYGLILPAWTLALPARGCLNIHASLLPRWRGAAPIQRAIEEGDAETGITIMQMDAGLDTGDTLLMETTPIGPFDTSATLHERLADIGARLIVQSVADLAALQAGRRAQPADGVTYAAKIDKAEAALDWQAPAAVLERRLRAFDPAPGCSTVLGGQVFKIWAASAHPVAPGAAVDAAGVSPGTVLLRSADAGLWVACGEGCLRLEALQAPGGKRLAAADFLRSPASQVWQAGVVLPGRNPAP